ncbi:hypothetical protein WA158_002898 [Blastocystis sp. Blastoise]
MLRVLNYLVGSGTASTDTAFMSDYEFSQPERAFTSDFGWELSYGKNKTDNSECCLFKTGVRTTTAENALKRIKTFRHPAVLKYINGNESDKGVFYITEACIPLKRWLQFATGKEKKDNANPINYLIPDKIEEDQLVSWIMVGLYNICSCLQFINEDTKHIHGFINENSVFVTKNGMWKLGCFDMLYDYKQDELPPAYFTSNIDKQISSYICPELNNRDYKLINECNSCIVDSYALGCLMETVFEGIPHPHVIDSSIYKCKNAPLARPPPSKLISSTFLKHPLVKCIQYLDEKSIKENEQKYVYYQSLIKYLPSFPSTICIEYILPLLEDEVYHGDVQLGPYVLPCILFIGKSMNDEQFSKLVSPCVFSLFSRKDRATRVLLLENIDSYINQLSSHELNSKLFDQICTGFTDTNNKMKEVTIRSMLSLAGKLNDGNQVKCVQMLSLLQQDPLPAIRTNVIICLGRIASSVNEVVRKQSIFPCIGRGLRDVFPKTREQSLKAISINKHFYDGHFLATKLLPALCPLLWDADDNVRTECFATVEQLIDQLKEYHAKWLKTGSAPVYNPPSSSTSTSSYAPAAYISSAVNIVSKMVTGAPITSPSSTNNANRMTSVSSSSSSVQTSSFRGDTAPASTSSVKSGNNNNNSNYTNTNSTPVNENEIFNKFNINATPNEEDNAWKDDDLDDDLFDDTPTVKKPKSTKPASDPFSNDMNMSDASDTSDLLDSNNDFVNTNIPSEKVKSNNINELMDDNSETKLDFEDDETNEEDEYLKKNLDIINQLKKQKEPQKSLPAKRKGPTTVSKPISNQPLDLDEWATEFIQESKPEKPIKSARSSVSRQNVLKKSTPLGTSLRSSRISTSSRVEKPVVKSTKNNDGWDDEDNLDLDLDFDEKPKTNSTTKTQKTSDGWSDDGWSDDDKW